MQILLGALLISLPRLAPAGTAQDVADADAELNRTYSGVQAALNQQARTYLKSVQRSWIAFKERDFANFSRLALQAHQSEFAFSYQEKEISARTQALLGLEQGKDINDLSFGDHPPTGAQADQQLNEVYRQCMAILPASQTAVFKEAQSLWIQFRDGQCRLDSTRKGGRVDDYVIRNLTMGRVLQLRRYIVVLLALQLPEDAPEAPEAPDSGAGWPDVFRFAR